MTLERKDGRPFSIWDFKDDCELNDAICGYHPDFKNYRGSPFQFLHPMLSDASTANRNDHQSFINGDGI